jgi:hypothetical protein
MHSCPRCGFDCDCNGDWDDIEVMTPEWVFKNCECDCDDDDMFEDDEDDFDDEYLYDKHVAFRKEEEE